MGKPFHIDEMRMLAQLHYKSREEARALGKIKGRRVRSHSAG